LFATAEQKELEASGGNFRFFGIYLLFKGKGFLNSDNVELTASNKSNVFEESARNF
jgi:hypothetical protein